jgi:1-acyl-sn-glycerol-3-phosphate acyltransferase
MIRVILIALAFIVLTLVLLPFQLTAIAFNLRLQRTIPHLYHRVLCALIGVRIREVGRRSTASPALILSNHVWPAQPVDATQALNLSAGVSNCKVSRGRSFS